MFLIFVTFFLIFGFISNIPGEPINYTNSDIINNNPYDFIFNEQNYRSYIMDYIEFPPDEQESPKPSVLSALPQEFNWINHEGKDWTTPARNQGPCGSCWAFAAVSCLESRINIAWDNPNLDIDLSEQYILSCLSSGSCSGGNSYSAFRTIMDEGKNGNYVNGIIFEECLPYQADDTVSCSEKSKDWLNQLVPISGYDFWNCNFPEDIDLIKSQLINEGPLVTYFYVTGDFASWGNSHHDPKDYYPYHEHSGANHAVIIVGYKDDSSIEKGGYWIAKNSWGERWGYNGFFNIEYGSLNFDNVQITTVKYDAKPVAGFRYEPEFIMPGNTVQFYDETLVLDGEVTKWNWDFHDGSFSNLENPVKKFLYKGVYNLSLNVIDSDGKEDTLSKFIYVGDTEPPITTTKINGEKGEKEWYTNHVKLVITANDTFSGVNNIMYNLDNGGYNIYRSPITVFGSKNEGPHTLSYYSVDNAGNKEEEKSISFKLDFSNPQIELSIPSKGRLYIGNYGLLSGFKNTIIIGPLQIKPVVSDSISGIGKVEFYLNNQIIDIDFNSPYSCIITGRYLGNPCTFYARVIDNSGRYTDSEKIYFNFFSLGILKPL
jgi:hypothetical protein